MTAKDKEKDPRTGDAMYILSKSSKYHRQHELLEEVEEGVSVGEF